MPGSWVADIGSERQEWPFVVGSHIKELRRAAHDGMSKREGARTRLYAREALARPAFDKARALTRPPLMAAAKTKPWGSKATAE